MAKKEKSATKKPRIWDGRGDRLEGMRFTLLPGNVADDLRVKGLHFRLLAHIGRQNAERGWCRISQSELAEKWGFNRGSINKVLKALVSWGYIEELTQKESRESWCAYRVVIDAKDADEVVSPTDDTPSSSDKPPRKGGVSSTDHRGVISSRQECHPPGYTHHTDKTDKTDQQERGRANAQPAAERNHFALDGEIVEPARPGAKPPKVMPKRKVRTALADDWLPDDAGVAFARVKGLADEQTAAAFEKFKAHHQAKGSVMADWTAAWRTWVLNEVKFSQATPPRGSARGGRADRSAFL